MLITMNFLLKAQNIDFQMTCLSRHKSLTEVEGLAEKGHVELITNVES